MTSYYIPSAHWEIQHCMEMGDQWRMSLRGVKYEDGRMIATDGKKMVIVETLPDCRLIGNTIKPRDGVRLPSELKTSAAGGEVADTDMHIADGSGFPNWRGIVPPIPDDAIAFAITPRLLADLAKALNPSGRGKAYSDRPLTIVVQKEICGKTPLVVVMGEDSDRIGLLAPCSLPDGAQGEVSRAQSLLKKLSARSNEVSHATQATSPN